MATVTIAGRGDSGWSIFSVSTIEKSVDNAAIQAYSWDMTREQLVAIVTALLVHMDGPVGRFDRPPLASYASGALEIVQAAEKAVAEEKGAAL
jgi:hypothetical protein